MKILGIIKEYIVKAGAYSFAKIERLDQVGSVVIKGAVDLLKTNVPYEFFGEAENDQRFGNILVLNEALTRVDLDRDTCINYFKSTAFDLIGEKSATSIADHLREHVIEKILEQPQLLAEVEGLTTTKQKIIINTLRKYFVKNSVKDIFEQQNLKVEFYNLLEKDCADEAAMLNTLEYSFYNYAHFKKLTPFEEVDRVAQTFSKDVDFEAKRIYWWAYKIAKDILFQTGNTWLTLGELRKKLQAAFPNQTTQILEESISRVNKESNLFVFDSGKSDGVKRIYTSESFEDENIIAQKLVHIERKKVNVKEFDFNDVIHQVEEYVAKTLMISNFKYNEEQRQAMLKFCLSNVSIITGGPGTGKTTVIIGLIKLYKIIYQNSSFSIMAPTGRAASRIKVDEQIFATTIHRFLKARGNDVFEHNEQNPLSKNLLIIDECSMIDNHLFAALLNGVIDINKIVLVGDKNQLPSVGYGNLYEDIIAAQKFSTTELLINNRQVSNGEQNSIIDLANAIRTNTMSSFDFNNVNNIEFLFDQDQETALQSIKKIYSQNNPHELKDQITDIQVIAPMYKNQLGVANLNHVIQDLVNPDKKVEYKRMNTVYRIKDKVMFTENNAILELYNGDVGYIKNLNMVNHRLIEATLNFSQTEKKLQNKQFANVTLSYACTIHKTQGSEYEVVVVVLDDSNYASWGFVNKKMLYTGITRAKKQLFIVSSQKLFLNACSKEMKKRETTLTKKIIEITTE